MWIEVERPDTENPTGSSVTLAQCEYYRGADPRQSTLPRLLLLLLPVTETHFGLHFAGGSIGTLQVPESFSH